MSGHCLCLSRSPSLSGGDLFIFGHLWARAPASGFGDRGGVSGFPGAPGRGRGGTGDLHGSALGTPPGRPAARGCSTAWGCPPGAACAGSRSRPSSPFETRLRLAFSRASSGSSSVAVSVWLLSPETLRFLSSRRVGLCGMSTAAWSVGGSLTGCLSTKYFSTGRSLSSGASKGSCLLPALYSPGARGETGVQGMKAQRSP